MRIVKFKECNVTYAENQPEYLSLPAHKSEDKVTSCWGLSILERLIIVLTGKVWLSVLTFNKPLQPLLMASNKPNEIHNSM